MRTKKLSARAAAACAAAAVAALRSAPGRADTTIYEYQFTNQSFNPTTVASNLVGAPFSYVNATPSNPPFNDPAFIVFGGTLPDDPAFFVGQADWFPTTLGVNSNYYTIEVSVKPGFSFTANTLSFVANSRQQVLFDMQVDYSNNSNFSNPVNFDTNTFIIPTTENWNPFAATDAPIVNGIATYYFRLNGTLDPNAVNGSISDLLNLGNVALSGTVQPYAGVTPMYWDPGSAGNPGSGGTGTWLAANTWADGAVDYNWSDAAIAESATFAGTAGGVVALGGSVSAIHGLNFMTAGYNITGTSGQTLTVAGTITANADATISCAMTASGTGTLTKAGTASLTLSGSTTFAPGASLAVSAGTLRLVNNVAPSGTNVIAAGAVLEFNDSIRLLQSPTTFTGTGTLRVTSSGGGDYTFGGSGAVNVDLSPGALIDVQSGMLTGSSSFGGDWDDNFASLNVAAGATFNIVEGGLTGTMHVDALTGGGTFLGGYQFNGNNGLTAVTIGDAGGGGVFSGSLQNNPQARLGIIKVGGGTETFSGSNTYSGGTTISGGALNISGAGALPVGMPVVNNSALNVYANNTCGQISGTGALAIGLTGTAATLKIATGSGTSTLGSLTIAGTSKLDISNNTVRINFGSPANDPVATISGYLKTGYSGGQWTGAGIDSSTAATNSTALAVGYADGNIDAGTAAGPNQIVVKYTLAGDANLDGLVNFSDLVAVVQNFNKPGTDWAHGNFGYGASTNFGDLVTIVQNFNKTLIPAGSSSEQLGGGSTLLAAGTALPPMSATDVQLPEPGSILMAAIPLVALLGRRRKCPECY